MLKDVKQRLHIQAMVGKMVVAEGIKDFHEQMEILLDKKVVVNTIGPELLEINRDTLNLALNLEQIKQPTAEDYEAIEAKLSAKMSNLTSPQNIMTPKSNRSIGLAKTGSLDKIQAVASVKYGGPQKKKPGSSRFSFDQTGTDGISRSSSGSQLNDRAASRSPMNASPQP